MRRILLLFGLFGVFFWTCGPGRAVGFRSDGYVNDRSCKYLADTSVHRFSSHRGKIAAADDSIVFECPAGFHPIDFDVFLEHGQRLFGVLLTDGNRTFLEIRGFDDGAGRLVKDMTAYHPWKILFADADNDSNLEVCLGVFKRTPLHPVPANGLFIYDFHRGLQPKWRGSRLSHPFTDFGFASQGHRSLLLGLEIGRNHEPRITTYEWDSFGFTAVPSKFDGTIPHVDRLDSGYILRDGVYRRVLFAMNRQKVCRVIDF